MRSMDSWLENKVVLWIVSFVIAIIIWMYVSYSPDIGKIERIMDVGVNVKNQPKNVIVEYQPKEIELRVVGFKEDMTSFSPDDISVYIDLKGLSKGKFMLPVSLKVPPSIRVEKVEPKRVAVTIVPLVKKYIPVRVSTIGFPPDGYIAEEPVVFPERVEVEGSPTILSAAKMAIVSVNMSDVRESVMKEVAVTVVDDSGKEIKDINVIPPKVDVAVKVKRGWPQKVVSVKPRIKGKPPKEWVLKGVSVKPASVGIEGPRDVISGISTVYTPPIDISRIKNRVMKIKLLPIMPSDKVRMIEKQPVVVTLLFAEKVINRTLVVPIEIRGRSVFGKWMARPDVVKVTIKGPYSAVIGGKVEAYVYVGNILTRKKVVKVKVDTPKGVSAVKVVPENVTVEVVK